MKSKKKIGLGLILLFVIGILTIGFLRSSLKPPTYQTKEFLMDTIVSVKATGENAEKKVEDTMQMMRRIAAKSNRFNEDSIVSEINRQAGVKPVKVGDDILTMIKTAKKHGRLTGGKFDITIAPIIELWGFGTEKNSVPAPEKIKEKLKLVNYQDIIIDEAQSTVMLAKKGMKIDLGGIAKGYIVDRAAQKLKEAGIKSVLINAGGNISTIGTKNGEKWRLGIRNPRDDKENPNDNYLDVIEVKDSNVVTSGDYERYFKEDGKRYHHILDPTTGYPSRGPIASVTVITDSSLQGDILSTALFIMGMEKAKSYIQKHDDIAGMIITNDLEKWKSPGFKRLLAE